MGKVFKTCRCPLFRGFSVLASQFSWPVVLLMADCSLSVAFLWVLLICPLATGMSWMLSVYTCWSSLMEKSFYFRLIPTQVKDWLISEPTWSMVLSFWMISANSEFPAHSRSCTKRLTILIIFLLLLKHALIEFEKSTSYFAQFLSNFYIIIYGRISQSIHAFFSCQILLVGALLDGLINTVGSRSFFMELTGHFHDAESINNVRMPSLEQVELSVR